MNCCTTPSTANATAMHYVVMDDCKSLPTNPVWKPYPFTGSIPTIARDLLTSSTLDGSPEINYASLGTFTISGDTAVEMMPSVHDDLIAGALQSDWVTGATIAGADVALTNTDGLVQATVAGQDLTAQVVVNEIVRFLDFTVAENTMPMIVTAITFDGTDTILTLTEMKDSCDPIIGSTTGETATTDIQLGDKLGIGLTRKYIAILVTFGDLEGGPFYDLIVGCETTGFSAELALNSNVTATLPLMGKYYYPGLELTDDLLIGSTFQERASTPPFTGIDGRLSADGVRIAGVQSISMSLDRGAAASMELGSKYMHHVSYSKATSTVSISNLFFDYDLKDKFIAETPLNAVVGLKQADTTYAMSFSYEHCLVSSNAVEVSEGDNTQSTELQPITQGGTKSTLVIRRIA